MVQVKNTQVAQKKMDAVRTGRIKVLAKNPKKIAPSSTEAVQYASLPGLFQMTTRIFSPLLAQVRKPGRSGKSTICIPGIKKTTTRRTRKLTSNVKLGTSKLYYSLDLKSDGVDALVQQGGQLFRVPLDVKAKWDSKRQKVVIDGKVLKSSRLINTFSGQRLHFDRKELAKLVKPQMDALVYKINNKITSSSFAGGGRTLKAIDGGLARLKSRLKSSFKKDSGVRAIRKALVKQHGTVKAHLISLLKQRRRVARLMKRRGFTKTFHQKLKTLQRQSSKLRGRLITLKSKLWNLIYKYWLHKPRKRPC